jgi:hypothetical protein
MSTKKKPLNDAGTNDAGLSGGGVKDAAAKVTAAPTSEAGMSKAGASEAEAAGPEADVPDVAMLIEANPEIPEVIVDLLRVSERLTAVMEREIEMIREMDPAEMKALQEQKSGLAAAYEARLRNVKESPSILDMLNDEVRGGLRALTERFAETLSRNAVAKQQRETAGYSPRGGHAAPSGTPISLDQRF